MLELSYFHTPFFKHVPTAYVDRCPSHQPCSFSPALRVFAYIEYSVVDS